MKASGGADIVVKQDGTIHHAGTSRWKAGGMAGAGGLAALAKFGALPLLLKGYWIFALFRLSTRGGGAAVFGLGAVLLIVVGSLWRFRRRRTA